MSVGAEQFREFVVNGPHTGRVRLCVRFTIKPGQVDAFKAEFQPVIDISVKEKGCAQYETISDFASPTTVWLLEDWETRDDLKAHMLAQTPNPKMADILDGPLQFNIML